MSNAKNAFVIDLPDNDPDVEDLMALKRVKDAISKKKKALKEKDWNAKHPNLVEMVEQYRRRKIQASDEKTEDGKIKLDLAPPVKPNVEIEEPKRTKRIEIQLSEVKEKQEPARKEPPKQEQPKQEQPKPVENFNKVIEKKAVPIPKFNAATGTFF